MPHAANPPYHRGMEARHPFPQIRGIRIVDALIALGLLALGILYARPSALIQIDAPNARDVLGYTLLALQSLPLAWRHTAPRAVVTVVLLAWIVDRAFAYEASLSTLGLIVAIHGVAAYAPRGRALAWGGGAAVIAILWTGVGALVTPEVGLVDFVTMFLWVGIPFAIGRGDAVTRERITEYEVMSQTAEITQQEAAEAAVRTERTRIARELHDVVAHEITVMTLQAEGARRAIGDANPQVAEALQTIGESGRKGLGEMHRMIGALRDTSEGDDAPPEPQVGTAYAPARVDFLAPMPSLAALPALAQQVEDAGLPVVLSIRGSAHVPAGVELSAYRIVQEALTNALKHAGPGAHATVDVDRARTAVTVTVEDDGRGVISETANVGGGHGLTGMRERVLTLGGSIDLGPRPGGGFRVRAVLPSQDDTIVTPNRKRQDSISTIASLVEEAEKRS